MSKEDIQKRMEAFRKMSGSRGFGGRRSGRSKSDGHDDDGDEKDTDDDKNDVDDDAAVSVTDAA